MPQRLWKKNERKKARKKKSVASDFGAGVARQRGAKEISESEVLEALEVVGLGDESEKWMQALTLGYY
jgi:hypothetical protein